MPAGNFYLQRAEQWRGKSEDDFKSVARHLECDEDKTRFEKALGKIAKAKPEKSDARK